MVIVASTATHDKVAGYINSDYTSLARYDASRLFQIYSSIQADISSYIAADTIAFVDWCVIFGFSALPANSSESFRAIATAPYGTYTVLRFGQATDDGNVNYQCYKTPPYGYTYGLGSATYPRGRYNPPTRGTVNWVEKRSITSQEILSPGGDQMVIRSDLAESGAITLQLQIQYRLFQWQYSTTSFYVFDV